ncbi:hypothetical protein Tco_0856797 [Tanacetum coccineum]|uniref:Uncharacterized protein n=1 Tax=Tanacetum coccineum TaxID=301880 RepID=A0ABQ5B4H1_9ASTR
MGEWQKREVVDVKKEVENGTDNEAIRSMKEEMTEEGIEELWRCLDAGDGVRIFPDGVANPATVIFDEKKP